MRLPRLTVVSALLAMGLIPGLLAPASARTPDVPPGVARGVTGLLSSDHGSPVARRALRQVQSLLQPKPRSEAKSLLQNGRGDATMAMRDLWVHRDQLSASDKAAAARVLSRPRSGPPICNKLVCVHYRRTGSDAATDGYAHSVRNVVTQVYNRYVRAGYRRPVSDGAVGGGGIGRVDIYLADLLPQGYYGYCSPDQRPGGQPKGSHVATAYCVLDNDYAGFPGTAPNDLRVTAAHEFFHAVQFAYDYAEDRWLMEATAVWAEDELYTTINDNLQYLRFGQLRRPRTALDRSGTLAEYGNWIFFRYLSERLPKTSGGLPVIMRRIWQAADSSRGRKHDRYSIWAVNVALRQSGRSFNAMYAGFAEANHRSRVAYREGRANHYPVAPVAGRVVLRPAKTRASGSYKLNHLTSVAKRFVPRNVRRGARLRVNVDLHARRTGAALLTTFHRHRGPTTRWIRLNRAGNGHAAVPFNPHRVSNVVLTLVNTGHAYQCRKGTVFACAGRPTQDRLADGWTARVV